MKISILFTFTLLFTTAFNQTVTLVEFASGLTQPIDISHCGDDRLFVAQQNGVIKIIESNGTVKNTPFLTITSLIHNSGEAGLLGMAFHPNYLENGYFFVNYIRNSDRATVIARYQVSDTDPDIASTDGEIVLTIAQPFSNHNGGSIKFGPDGNLFIGMGDGGSGGDPNDLGQNKTSLLGKMLRINVDELPYTIPSDNPYADGVNGKPEIYSIGLRNPWKFSFDMQDEKIWIGDVGQNAWEEINAQPASATDLNYGWRCYEGNATYNMSNCDPNASYVSPVHVYPLSTTLCAVTGGYVYRGTVNPGWVGNYFFSDYCSSQLFVLNPSTSEVVTNSGFSGGFASFGEDENGELYVAARNGGKIYRLTSPTASIEIVQPVAIAVYPNPTSDQLTIESNEAQFMVSIFNLEGKLIAQVNDQKVVDLKNVEEGIYMVHYQSSEHQKTVKITVKGQ